MNNAYKSDKSVTEANVEQMDAIKIIPQTRRQQIIERLKEAAFIVVLTQKASVLYLKKRMGLNNMQAEKMMNRLESAGIVGPKRDTGIESRDILVSTIDELDRIFEKISETK